MYRFQHIEIKGFKDDERVIDFTFSPLPVTVIYGDNGCGKTTFLKVLHAILTRNERILEAENVRRIKLHYTVNDEQHDLVCERASENTYKWTGEEPIQQQTKSILVGMYRGIFQSRFYTEAAFKEQKELWDFGKMLPNIILNLASGFGAEPNSVNKGIRDFLAQTAPDALFEISNNNSQHLFQDGTSITTVEERLAETNYEQEMALMDSVENAFWETFNALASGNGEEISPLSEEELQKLRAYSELLLTVLENDEKTTVNHMRRATADFLQTFEPTHLKYPSQTLLLRNMLSEIERHKAQTYNPVHKVIRYFNEHLGRGKKLTIYFDKVHIELPNGKTHPIADLSSGERNLLTLLALLIVEGDTRNFLLIDEPENSLNLKWQRSFLTLIQDIAPQAQIIIASHSPAIAKNTNSLRELL